MRERMKVNLTFNFLHFAGVCYTTRGGGNPSVSRAGEGYGLTVITVHEDANPYDASVARSSSNGLGCVNPFDMRNQATFR